MYTSKYILVSIFTIKLTLTVTCTSSIIPIDDKENNFDTFYLKDHLIIQSSLKAFISLSISSKQITVIFLR